MYCMDWMRRSECFVSFRFIFGALFLLFFAQPWLLVLTVEKFLRDDGEKRGGDSQGNKHVS